MHLYLPSPLQEVTYRTDGKEYTFCVKRDDLIHPDISGNKWRKLNRNMEKARESGKNTILTIGGAFSNHIRATVAVTKMVAMNSIGVIRGEELNNYSNENLSFASEQGMKLYFVSRDFYSKRYETGFEKMLMDKLGLSSEEIYYVPEGGANNEGAEGCGEIIRELNSDFDYLITACGTGTTFAGLLNATSKGKEVIGVSVLKDSATIHQKIIELSSKDYLLMEDYHFGGYAKTAQDLKNFIHDFQTQTDIPLDYVYTGKMFYGVIDLLKRDYFESGSKIIALHTGGVANAGVV